MLQGDWEGLNKVNGDDVTAKIYFRDITILTKESADASTPKTKVNSPKLGTGMANPPARLPVLCRPHCRGV